MVTGMVNDHGWFHVNPDFTLECYPLLTSGAGMVSGETPEQPDGPGHETPAPEPPLVLPWQT